MPLTAPRLRGWLDWLAPAEPRGLPELGPRWARRRPRLFAAVVAGLLGASYLLMINRYWHITPDSGIYLTLAQNLAEGKGYVFNGVPHSKYPAGAPFFLSLLLRVSRRFLWLNVAECLVILTGLGVLYLALRELTGRPNAALIVLLTGVLFWVHEFATTHKSEPVFFLCSNLTVLCLLRLVRGRRARARALWLVGLCVAWTAAFLCRVGAAFWLGPIVVTLLLAGRPAQPLRNRMANAALAALVIGAASLLYLHWSGQAATAADALRAAGAEGAGDSPPEYTYYFSPEHTVRRALLLVRWPLLLLCPPWEPLARPLLGGIPAEAGHWAASLVVLLGAWTALRRGQVFLAASVLFLGPFAVSGPSVWVTHGRYVNGVAPFLIILLLLGLGAIGEFGAKRIHAALNRRTLVAAGILAVLVPNLLLLAGKTAVQRHPDFYRVFRAGAYSELTAILKWMSEHEVEGPVGLHHPHASGLVPCLTKAHGLTLAARVTADSPDFEQEVAGFARSRGLRYIVTFDTTQPWPVWHIPRHWLGGPRPRGPRWRLWEYSAEDGALRALEVPPAHHWPTALPDPEGRDE